MQINLESVRLTFTYIDKETGREEEIQARIDYDGSWNQWGNISEMLSKNMDLLDAIAFKVAEIACSADLGE